jgi:hypothetical protein
LSQTDGRINNAIVIAKRVCEFRLMPVKAKCTEGNTEDKLSPSSVMNSTQLACKMRWVSFTYITIRNLYQNRSSEFREGLHKALGKEQPATDKSTSDTML